MDFVCFVLTTHRGEQRKRYKSHWPSWYVCVCWTAAGKWNFKIKPNEEWKQKRHTMIDCSFHKIVDKAFLNEWPHRIRFLLCLHSTRQKKWDFHIFLINSGNRGHLTESGGWSRASVEFSRCYTGHSTCYRFHGDIIRYKGICSSFRQSTQLSTQFEWLRAGHQFSIHSLHQ